MKLDSKPFFHPRLPGSAFRNTRLASQDRVFACTTRRRRKGTVLRFRTRPRLRDSVAAENSPSLFKPRPFVGLVKQKVQFNGSIRELRLAAAEKGELLAVGTAPPQLHIIPRVES